MFKINGDIWIKVTSYAIRIRHYKITYKALL
jgi:hypothetical protein